jgi:hypothetical protein
MWAWHTSGESSLSLELMATTSVFSALIIAQSHQRIDFCVARRAGMQHAATATTASTA